MFGKVKHEKSGVSARRALVPMPGGGGICVGKFDDDAKRPTETIGRFSFFPQPLRGDPSHACMTPYNTLLGWRLAHQPAGATRNLSISPL
jgi:hypothetical protein